jgi:alpha-beta hydrolase superfamily lysophospholipase
VGVVVGFVPWIVYWALVGNVDFRLAVTVAFLVALLGAVMGRVRGQRIHALDVGSLAVFAALLIAAYAAPDDFLERWLQPLSNAGLFLIVLVGVLAGRPFVREYAVASVDEATARSDGFRVITTAMTWMWVVAFGVMLVSSLIPPIVDGDATIRDEDDTLSIVFYWVIPFVAIGIAGAISAAFPPWFESRSAQVDRRTAEEPEIVAQAPPPADASEGGVAIDAPADSRFDEPFPVAVRGLPAGARVEVSASGHDLHGRLWRSEASFNAPASGLVEPGDGAPIASMRFAAPDAVPELFVPPAEPWEVTVEAAASGGSGGRPATARRTVVRRIAAQGVRFEPVDLDGLPGLLALPPGPAPGVGLPAVACFGGSEGGFESQIANAGLLASHGYAALAQAWIAGSEAAEGISEVPLERFGRALERLAGREGVDPSRMAAMAISRGAEGLLAAVSGGLAPPMRGVVLVSPSCVTWQAIGASGEIPDTASWTARGEPVPWVPVASGALMRQIVHNAWTVGRDAARHRPSLLRLGPAYEASLARREGAPPAATIDAGAAACPLLLMSGDDDQVWPSGAMAQALAEARRGAGAGEADELVGYPGAGHLIRLGLLPTDAQWTSGIALGGGGDGQAGAQADATERVLAFLARHTAAP